MQAAAPNGQEISLSYLVSLANDGLHPDVMEFLLDRINGNFVIPSYSMENGELVVNGEGNVSELYSLEGLSLPPTFSTQTQNWGDWVKTMYIDLYTGNLDPLTGIGSISREDAIDHLIQYNPLGAFFDFGTRRDEENIREDKSSCGHDIHERAFTLFMKTRGGFLPEFEKLAGRSLGLADSGQRYMEARKNSGDILASSSRLDALLSKYREIREPANAINAYGAHVLKAAHNAGLLKEAYGDEWNNALEEEVKDIALGYNRGFGGTGDEDTIAVLRSMSAADRKKLFDLILGSERTLVGVEREITRVATESSKGLPIETPTEEPIPTTDAAVTSTPESSVAAPGDIVYTDPKGNSLVIKKSILPESISYSGDGQKLYTNIGQAYFRTCDGNTQVVLDGMDIRKIMNDIDITKIDNEEGILHIQTADDLPTCAKNVIGPSLLRTHDIARN